MSNPPKQANRGWSSFAIEQKVGVLIFTIVGVLGVIMSVIYLGQSLRAPFNIDDNIAALEFASEREAREVEEQKSKDTDNDGISDYDELNVYRTSPYLADSDSDGIDDGQEVKAGDDPNCPTGQDCGRSVDAGFNSAIRAADISEELPFEDVGLGQDGSPLTAPVQSEQDITALLQSLTVDDIRATLAAEGIDQATLDAMSDEELTQLFDEALKQVQESGSL